MILLDCPCQFATILIEPDRNWTLGNITIDGLHVDDVVQGRPWLSAGIGPYCGAAKGFDNKTVVGNATVQTVSEQGCLVAAENAQQFNLLRVQCQWRPRDVAWNHKSTK